MQYSLQAVRILALLFSILALPAWLIGVGIPISVGYFAFYRFTRPALAALAGNRITDKEFKLLCIGMILGFISSVLTVLLFHSLSALDGSGEYKGNWLYYGYSVVGVISVYLVVVLLSASKQKAPA